MMKYQVDYTIHYASSPHVLKNILKSHNICESYEVDNPCALHILFSEIRNHKSGFSISDGVIFLFDTLFHCAIPYHPKTVSYCKLLECLNAPTSPLEKTFTMCAYPWNVRTACKQCDESCIWATKLKLVQREPFLTTIRLMVEQIQRNDFEMTSLADIPTKEDLGPSLCPPKDSKWITVEELSRAIIFAYNLGKEEGGKAK